MAEDVAPENGDEQPDHSSDFSVPWWVWVILGFALLMAVAIVMIISGAGGTPAPRPAVEETVVEPTTGPTTEPATTGPSTTTTAPAE